MFPPEIILTISEYLGVEDYISFRASNRVLNEILEGDLWNHVHITNWKKNPFSDNNNNGNYLVQKYDYRGTCDCKEYYSWMDHSCERRYMSFSTSEAINTLYNTTLNHHVRTLTLTNNQAIAEFGDIGKLTYNMPNLRSIELDHWNLDQNLINVLCGDEFRQVGTVKLWNCRVYSSSSLEMTAEQEKILASKLKCLTITFANGSAEQWCQRLLASGILKSARRLDLNSDHPTDVVSATTLKNLLSTIDNLNVLRVSFIINNPWAIKYIPSSVNKLSIKSNDMDGAALIDGDGSDVNGESITDLSVHVLGNHRRDGVLNSIKCPNLNRLYIQNFFNQQQSKKLFKSFPQAKIIEFDFTSVLSDWDALVRSNSQTLQSLVLRYCKGEKEQIFKSIIDLIDRYSKNELPNLESLFIVLPRSTCDDDEPINIKFQLKLMQLVEENVKVYLGLPYMSQFSQKNEWISNTGYAHIKDHMNYVHYTRFANYSVYTLPQKSY